MKKFNYILLSLLLILLTGCSTKETLSTNEPATITEISKATITEETQITETEEVQSKYPEYVEEIYRRFSTCISEYFPQFTLDEIESSKVETSQFYIFSMKKNAQNFSYINIQKHKEHLYESFYIDFFSSYDSLEIRTAIQCGLLVIDRTLTLDDAESIVSQLINSFNGTSKSDVFTVNNYRVYLEPPSSYSDSVTFQAISIKEINREIDTSQYEFYDKEAYKAPLNSDSLAYINGTILDIIENENGSHCLTVLSDEDTYLIYYPFNQFLDLFEVNQQYTFYGQISTYTEPYTGRLFLHYCE